jgi:hypothetical protein
MVLDFSNEYVRNAVGLVAIFLPHFALMRVYKLARYSAFRTTRGYVMAGLLLLGSTLFYFLVLDHGQRIIFGGFSLLFLTIMVVADFVNGRLDSR